MANMEPASSKHHCAPLGRREKSEQTQQEGGGSATPLILPVAWQGFRDPSQRRQGKRTPLHRRPRRQGDSDGLCGLYAVLNALRLVYEPHGGLSATHERLIWASLVRYADRKWRFTRLFLGGTQTHQFLDLARYGAKLAHRETGKKIVLKQLQRIEIPANAPALPSVVRVLLSKGCRSILAGLECKEFSHWTVIAGVTDATVQVLDSGGYHFLRLKGCQLDLNPRPKGSPRYWVRIYGGFAFEDEHKPKTQRKPQTQRSKPKPMPKPLLQKDNAS